MSSTILQGVSNLLAAKSHETNLMARGVTVKELATALDVPHTSINAALRNEIEAARYGIFKLTPNRQRYVLWAYSKDVQEKAIAAPFGNSAGIDRDVQTAEVRKMVAECPDTNDHEVMNQLRQTLDETIVKFGLSIERNELLTQLFAVFYEKMENES